MEATGRIEGLRILAVAAGLAAYSSDGNDVFARAALKYWGRAQALMTGRDGSADPEVSTPVPLRPAGGRHAREARAG